MFAVTVRGMSGVSTASVSGSEGDDVPEGPSLREGVLTVHTQIVFTSESVSLSGAGAAAGNKTLFDKVSVVYTLFTLLCFYSRHYHHHTVPLLSQSSPLSHSAAH